MSLRSSFSKGEGSGSLRFSRTSSGTHSGLDLHEPSRDKSKILISYAHIIVVIIFCMIPWVPAHLLEKKISIVREEAERYQSKIESVQKELSAAVEKRRQLKDHVGKLTKENNELLNILKVQGDMIDPENNLYKKAEQEEEMYMERIKQIENGLQTWSRGTLREKFGPGALQYSIRLVNEIEHMSQTVVIETLPIDFVPHSIAIFNQLVDLKQFDQSGLAQEVGDCLNFKSDELEVTKSISFVEKPFVSSMIGMNVLIAIRGSRSAVLFCSHDCDRSGHEIDIESVFATVSTGAEFLESLSRSNKRRNWSVQSVRLLKSVNVED